MFRNAMLLDLDAIFDPDRRPPIRGVADLPADWRELWEERAAIMQFDSGMSRDAAERSVWLEIRRSMKSVGLTLT
jgi:hypothetical protein